MAIYKSDIVNIDLDSGSIFRSFLNNTIGTADKDANRFGVRVFRSGAEVDLSGCSCYGYFRDPQGNNIALTSVGTVSGNEAYVTLPQACYNYEGQFCLAIKLIGGGVTGTVRIIDGVVDNTNTGSAVAPTSAVPTYTEILSQYDAMVAATAAANTAIAPTFAQGTAYAAGALVINDGALYALPNGHTAGTTWANTTKVATNLGDQVTGLKSAIDLTYEDIPWVSFPEFTQGTIDGSGNPTSSDVRIKSSWQQFAKTRYIKIHPNTGYKFRVFYFEAYNVPSSLAKYTDYMTGDYVTELGYVVRIVIGKTNDGNIVPGEASSAIDLYTHDPISNRLESEINELQSYTQKIDLDNIINAETIPYKIGSTSAYIRADTGATATASNWERTDFVNVEGYDYLVYSRVMWTASSTNGGTAFYTSNSADAFISNSGDYIGIDASVPSYEERIIPVPPTAKYARFTLYKGITGFYIKGIKSNPLKGLKLSLLGASIETFAGAVPEGNNVYYTGSNHGVKSVNEIWWKRVCNSLGMTPLVIDAWSGSAVCYNYSTDGVHTDVSRVPMCSDLRTGRLHDGDTKPDIILIIGGTNDWTYSNENTTPLGDWNGRTAVNRTAVVSGESTFMESYASMIQKLHTNYPEAIIVGLSCEFTCRGTDLGCTRVNDMGLTENDYSDAIERVCKIMGIPYLNVYDVGFNYENYYPTYAEDDATTTTHPNSLGHAIIAKRVIEELPRLVKQFKG